MALFLTEAAFLGTNPPEKANFDVGNLGEDKGFSGLERQGKSSRLGW